MPLTPLLVILFLANCQINWGIAVIQFVALFSVILIGCLRVRSIVLAVNDLDLLHHHSLLPCGQECVVAKMIA